MRAGDTVKLTKDNSVLIDALEQGAHPLRPSLAARRRGPPYADRTVVCDTSTIDGDRPLASYARGALISATDWPPWAPTALR